MARQPEGARRDAEHRERAGDHGRPRLRAQDARGADREVPGQQLRHQRKAAPRRLLQALNAGEAARRADKIPPFPQQIRVVRVGR